MNVARTAEYSIKGYAYQFLQYLDELLSAGDDGLVTIEGAIEDVDVLTPIFQKAVQCKYHETVEKFTLGKIYKPILLMLEHFSLNQDPIIPTRYQLFCHFPGQTGDLSLTSEQLQTVRSTTDKALAVISARIGAFDENKFLNALTITFGPPFLEKEQQVIAKIIAEGFGAEDVKSIIYPVAFQRVVDMGTKSSFVERTIKRSLFLGFLKDTKNTTLTRWTRELSTKEKIFKRLRDDFSLSLSPNLRKRYFVINGDNISKFNDEIALFIKRFVEKYNSKYLHSHSPTFLFKPDKYDAASLVRRLFDIGIVCNDGCVGGEFNIKKFLTAPMIARKKGEVSRDFQARVAILNNATNEKVAPSDQQPDDVFLVNTDLSDWPSNDTARYAVEIDRLSELEYLLKLKANL